MICKNCSLKKQSAYFTLKQLLPTGIEHPIYHSTSFSNARKILREGFRARAGGTGNDAHQNNAVCFSRDICFSEKNHFGDGEVIFVLDLNKLKSRFITYPIDWTSRRIHHLTHKKLTDDDRRTLNRYEKAHEWHEHEERVTRSPAHKDPETVIPTKYIEAVICRQKTGAIALWEQFGDKFLFIRRVSNDDFMPVSETGKYLTVTNPGDFHDETAEFLDYVAEGQLSKVEKMLIAGFDVHVYEDKALHLAKAMGNTDMVSLLLEYGAV